MGTKEKVKQATIGRATITDEPAPAAPAPKPTAIDFTGKVKKENYPQVLMVCRKGQDQKTAGQRCQGKMAYRMSGRRNRKGRSPFRLSSYGRNCSTKQVAAANKKVAGPCKARLHTRCIL